MISQLLEIKNLSVSIDTPDGNVEAVRNVSLSLQKGEVLAIVGESGCGKSILCKSIMKLLPRHAKIEQGSIIADGTDITHYTERNMVRLRGSLFSMIFQDPMTALDPTMTIGAQIAEAVLVHNKKMPQDDVYRRVIELMELVGIEHPQERYKLYPYHFSGGMRQRCVMAIALAGNPRILLADEPTTALDVTIQAQILDLLRDIQKKLGTAAILVSHDLGVVARAADRVAIMYAGKIVEIGTAKEVYYDPRHPYTWGLLQALPALAGGRRGLHTIPGMPPTLIDPPKGDAFAPRNEYALAIDYEQEPPMFRITDTHYAATWLLDARAPRITCPVGSGNVTIPHRSERNCDDPKQPHDILLSVEHLTHFFRLSKRSVIRAVDDLSFQLRRGEILGLVGESGSGKSTVARCIMNIYRPASGSIFYEGIDTCDPSQYRAHRARLERERQLIFQDSASSLNQRMKAADIIAEPMAIHKIRPPRGSLRAEAAFQLHYVGMDACYLDKYPSELSGGQRQRVAIARALSMEPKLLVADEPIASLDVSIQAQIINLFRHLREEHGFSILFIAHDLAMVEYLCDRAGVMYQGRLIELAPAGELFQNPCHPYTKALLSAIPIPDPVLERQREHVSFDSQSFDRSGMMHEIAPDHFVLQGKECEV